MKSDIYKEFYQFEWDHRSHLTSALNIPIAGATIVGGGIVVMIQGVPYTANITTSIFVLFSAIAVLCLLGVLLFIFKAFHGYKYKRIATPLTFTEYYKELLAWHTKYGQGKASADERFEEYFNQRLAEAAEVNAQNNKNRSAYLYRANASLALCLLFMVFSSVPYLIIKVEVPEKIYSIKIVEPIQTLNKELFMPENEENQTQNQNSTPEPPPPEPTPPRNEDIKEYGIDREVGAKILTENKSK